MCDSRCRGFGCAAHGKFVHIELAYYYHSLVIQTVYNRCIVCGNEVFEYLGGAGCKNVLSADVIFNAYRYACEPAVIFTAVNSLLHFLGSFISLFFAEGVIAVIFSVVFVYCRKKCVNCVLYGNFFIFTAFDISRAVISQIFIVYLTQPFYERQSSRRDFAEHFSKCFPYRRRL